MNHSYRWTLKDGVYGSVANAVANLSEDLSGSQIMLDESLSAEAKAYAEQSLEMFKAKMETLGVKCEATLFCELGRIGARLVSSDFDLRLQARRFV